MPQVGRILVVDDQADARNILAELLQREGYTVETAANGDCSARTCTTGST